MMTSKRQRLSGGGVTIKDVAAKAAVSSMTVSRVINNEGAVSPSTRERVQSVIRELNFAPNAAAQRLATARSAKVALLYDNPSAGFMSEFLLGALDESGRTGAQLMVLKHEEGEPILDVIQAVIQAGAEGVVLPPPLCDSEPTVAALQAAGLRVVAVAPGLGSGAMSTVRIDNMQAAREIADHLLGLGHRRFGFIGGHPNQTVSEQRRRGFVDQLRAAGIAAEDIQTEQGLFTYKSGLEAADRLLTRDKRPTAIFAANDDMAAATVALAHRLGIETPKDLSIVGFDDTQIASAISPSLTTIRQPVAAMAAAALALLADEIRGRRAGTAEAVQQVEAHALIVRESTGKAPRA